MRYRASWKEADILRAYEFIASRGQPNLEIQPPVFIAEDTDHGYKGVFTLQPSDQAIIAGRLVADSPIVAFRLAELLDDTMALLGVSSYYVPIDKEDERTQGMAQRLYGSPIGEEQGCLWFQREMTSAEQEGQRTS